MLAKGPTENTPHGTAQPTARDEVFSLLDDSGKVKKGGVAPEVSDEHCKQLYRGLLQVRIVDDRMMKHARQGRIGSYMMSLGEEATHFGGAFPLRATDWIFPSYREPGAAFWRGYALTDYVNQLFGNAADTIKGRQMPVHHSAKSINYVSISSPVGTQIPQATGMAMAAKVSGRDDVALAYFGEGGTSTGEFHVGLNFAGVWKAPVIFLCRNNGWAVSTSAAAQTASPSYAIKGLAYGITSVRVDGNDLLALISAVGDAAARARRGEGPTLIEAITYRMAGHSSSDDPSAYRDPSQPEQWEARDPLERWRRYLDGRGLWDKAMHDQLASEITDQLGRAVAAAERLGAPALDSMFEDVYAEPTPQLREQQRYLLASPRAASGHQD